MTAEEIIKEVKTGVFKPVYALYGDEPYFIDQVELAITTYALSEAERAFNEVILYGQDVQSIQLLDYVGRFPMMAARQLVVVREAQEMKSIEPLAPYFEKPAPTTILVMCFKGKKPDFRTRAGKALKINAVCLEAKSLYENQIPEWLMREAKIHQLVVSSAVANLMTEYLGTDLQTIGNQLKKLAITLPPGTSVTEAHVKTHVGQSRDYNIFDLYKVMAERNAERSMKIVFRFCEHISKNPLVPLVSGLYNFYSKVWVYHQLAQKSETEQVAAMGLKSAWALKDYKLAARYYTSVQCTIILKLLKEFDLKSKGVGGSEDEDQLMKEMVMRIVMCA
jgi:DNA polymerase III subunit delta